MLHSPNLLTSPNTAILNISRLSEGIQYWGVEGILCGVMKLKNVMFAKGRV